MWMLKRQRVAIPAPGTDQRIPVFGALNYRSNHVSYRIGQHKNATEFLAFLAQLAAEYRGRRCLLVLDNASYHTAHVVRQYLSELDATFRVLWLPPYSPELNVIEHIWKYIKGSSLANYDFGNTDNIRDAIIESFKQLNGTDHTELGLHFRDPLSKTLLRVA
jgi:transposase